MADARQSLDALLKRTTIQDHLEILKECNTSLKGSKGNLEVQHIKIVALLKLERYEDALRVFEEGGDALKQKGQLERAYALYKNGDLEEARTVARNNHNARGARHVEAQSSYRLEDFDGAKAIYQALAGSQAAIEGEENDLRINTGATDAQLEWSRQGHLVQKKKPAREDLEVFETAYNAACGCIARGELGQGEVLLKRAKDLCNSLEELSEEQKIEELLPISVQQLYVLCRLGKAEESERIASEISLNEIPNLSTRQIAQINQLSISSKDSNSFMSQRLLKSSEAPPDSDKLFQYQADQLHENELTQDLLAFKPQGVIKSTLRAMSNSPLTPSAHMNKLSVLHAAAHAQNELGKFGLKKILPLMEKRPNDIGLVMTIVQLYILTNNQGSAITVMETLVKRLEDSNVPKDQDVRFAPGLVAVAVSLYALQGRRAQMNSELAKAAQYWQHKPRPPEALLQAAGLSLLQSTTQEDQATARGIFRALRTHKSDSHYATAGFVAAHALTSSSEATERAGSLTTVNRLTSGVDIDTLEKSGVASPALPTSAKTSAKRPLDEKPKPAKKRVRKSRLPKDYEPGKVADPERWLPLRERSSYRPKGKKGKQKAAALTQGGMSDKAAGAAVETGKSGGEGVLKGGNVSSSKNKKKKGKK